MCVGVLVGVAVAVWVGVAVAVFVGVALLTIALVTTAAFIGTGRGLSSLTSQDRASVSADVESSLAEAYRSAGGWQACGLDVPQLPGNQNAHKQHNGQPDPHRQRRPLQHPAARR